LEANLEKMFTFLRVPWMDDRVDVVSIAERKITSVAGERGSCPSERSASRALVRGFEKALDAEFLEGRMLDYELDMAARLEREKYRTRMWNWKGKTALP
jgi:lipoate-protein ligase A